jgi:outer membrane immunogenic protein
MRVFFGAAVLATALSSVVHADGMPGRYAPPCCAFSWTGVYIGANAGGAWSDLSNSLAITNTTPAYFNPLAIPGVNASGSPDLSSSGFTGGGQIGFNVQSGQIVWGIELDFNSLRLKESAGGNFLYTTNGAPYILTEEASTNWLLTLRPRVGLAMDRGLAYVTAGLAVTRLHFNQFFAEPPFTNPPEAASISKTNYGWTLGGGYEHAFAHNWTFKAEYLFTRFDVDDAVGVLAITSGPAAGRGATFVNNLDHLDIHTLRVGINYKFGGDCCTAPLK